MSRRKQIRVLMSSCGRRVELVQLFRAAAERLGVGIRLVGTDASMVAPAMHHVDRAEVVPAIRKRGFVDAMLEIVARHGIDLLVPTIDTELPKLAAARDRFAERGCTVLVSSPTVIATCYDKVRTCEVLTEAGLDTPMTWRPDTLPPTARRRYPCFVKVRTGSAAKGAARADDAEDLRYLLKHVDDAVVQEYLPGVEHTQDVYCGLDGRVRCVVARRRLEVRAGEVQKAVIVDDPRLIAMATRTVEALGECRGVLNVQCVVGPKGRVSVLEINPRFGGGSPLAIHAGADFPRWLMAEWLGRRVRIGQRAVRIGTTMLRYDQSVFLRSQPT